MAWVGTVHAYSPFDLFAASYSPLCLLSSPDHHSTSLIFSIYIVKSVEMAPPIATSDDSAQHLQRLRSETSIDYDKVEVCIQFPINRRLANS